MDLLFKRYASPFSFIDGMIQTCSFSKFVDDFIETVIKEREEEEERLSWEYFLHRVYDKSYKAFKESMENDEKNKKMSEGAIETTIQSSMDILKNFKPAGGEK